MASSPLYSSSKETTCLLPLKMWGKPQVPVIGQHQQPWAGDLCSFCSAEDAGKLPGPGMVLALCALETPANPYVVFYKVWGIQVGSIHATDMFSPNRCSAWLDTWLPFGQRTRPGHGRRTVVGMRLGGAAVHSLKRLSDTDISPAPIDVATFYITWWKKYPS